MIDRSTMLRRLSRFDAATMEDLKDALGIVDTSQTQQAWRVLNKLAAEGLVEIDKSQGVARYRVVKRAA